ncbi:MAG TPA: rhodanese-like domain-containing protein [Mycobacteriales bacterium]|jgi:rhodanese-related sulfurtransferase|nr:rhodanese-like domain-containing protein [Mycobacteriales bacterium]
MSPSRPSVSVAELTGDEHLLDVREADEWAAGHAEQAQFVPMSELAGRLGELPKEREVVVVCKSGARSAQVTAYLNQNGWSARNLVGGMVAWEAASRPLVSDSGVPPVVI